MGCAGMVRGLYSLLNIKVNNKFRIDGTINIRGVLGRESGASDLPYNKVHYDLKLTAKHCYSLGRFLGRGGNCALYIVLTYLLQVALFLLIGVQYLQKRLVDLWLTLEPILSNKSKYIEVQNEDKGQNVR